MRVAYRFFETRSVFRLEKKLSIAALPQQLHFRATRLLVAAENRGYLPRSEQKASMASGSEGGDVDVIQA